MIIFLYSIIVILATAIGATTGLGGGVIIKPLFDLLNVHSLSSIGLYSSIAVFTMTIVAMIKQYRQKTKFDLKIAIYLSIGSIIGGIIGEYCFDLINRNFQNYTKPIQALSLALLLFALLIYSFNANKIKTYKLKKGLIIILVGILLATVSIFLGIGGGPLNIALLMFLFSYDPKQSVVLSIVIIFFSQLSKLIKVFLLTDLANYDLAIIPFIVIAGIIGGLIGTSIYKRLNNNQITKLYNILLISLILLSLYNFYVALYI